MALSSLSRLFTVAGLALIGAAALLKPKMPPTRNQSQLAKDATPVRAALEPARGRQAERPWQISKAGWRDILWRTFQEAQDDRILAVAGGVVFFAFLSVFPTITAIISLYSLVSTDKSFERPCC